MFYCVIRHNKFATRLDRPIYSAVKLRVFHGVNLLGDNINTMKRNIKPLIDLSMEVDLEVSMENFKYVLMSHHQNAR
jgi:hypothetical protein